MSINNAVLGARDRLLAAGIQLLHVVGPKNLSDRDRAHGRPRHRGGLRTVGFVEQMELAYAAADLMLGRCGAGTVLETAAVGLPAVFVPYPHGNGEQARNAELVVKVGGGLLLVDADCTAEWVATEIPALIHHPDRLAGMTEALHGVARGDAATVLASRGLEVQRLMGSDLDGRTAGAGRAGPGALHRHRGIRDERDRVDDGRAGLRVSGSDRQDSKYLQSLAAQGARVHVGHRAEQLGDARTVVASSAIREDNPELAEARRRGLRVLHRSAALGSLMLGRRGSRWPAPTARPPRPR